MRNLKKNTHTLTEGSIWITAVIETHAQRRIFFAAFCVVDRRDRPEQTGADDAPAGEESGSHRATESQRSHEVGGADEHLQSSGRGNPDGGAYQQLTLNLFLSEAEQIQSIDEAENVAHTSSAFSFAQNDIDHVLRLGGNYRYI